MRRTDDLILRVHLSPRAARDSIAAADIIAGETCLRVRVRALPNNGAANQAMIDVLAAWLGVAKSRLRLCSGAKSRHKRVAVCGCDETTLARLKERLETGSDQA
jgi:uncharacterized protein (TIGR00251 family)